MDECRRKSSLKSKIWGDDKMCYVGMIFGYRTQQWGASISFLYSRQIINIFTRHSLVNESFPDILERLIGTYLCYTARVWSNKQASLDGWMDGWMDGRSSSLRSFPPRVSCWAVQLRPTEELNLSQRCCCCCCCCYFFSLLLNEVSLFDVKIREKIMTGWLGNKE